MTIRPGRRTYCFDCGRPLVITEATLSKFQDEDDVYHADCSDFGKRCTDRGLEMTHATSDDRGPRGIPLQGADGAGGGG